MSRFLRSLLPAVLLVAPATFADDPKCPCGMTAAQCKQAGCACDAANCPMLDGGMGRGPGPHAGMMRGARAMAMMPAFDPKTVTTIKGTVTAVERVEHGGGQIGVHLAVKSGADTVTVHVGPAAFVDAKMTFAEKDEVEVTGSKVTWNGEPTLLTTVIKKGGKTLEARKADGTALFRGMGMGPPAK